MIPIEDARAIVAGLDPSRLVRLVYRAVADTTPPTGRESLARSTASVHPYTLAGVVLDLRDGRVRVLRWHPDEDGHDPLRMPPHLVALAWADTALVESIETRHAENSVLRPSQEVLEECIARDAAADNISVSWDLFEGQLQRSYGLSPRWGRSRGEERR